MGFDIIKSMKLRNWTIGQAEKFFKTCEALGWDEEVTYCMIIAGELEW